MVRFLDWARIAQFPASLLNHAVLLLAKLPGDDIPLASPPTWMIAAYYLLLCVPAVASLRMFARFRDRVCPPWPSPAIWPKVRGSSFPRSR